MKKNQIIGIIIVIILVFCGIIGWALFQKGKLPIKEVIPEKEKIIPEKEIPEEEVFGLSAYVLKVDVENNFLIIKSEKDGRELKVILSEDTQLIRIDLPKELPEEEYFITKKTEIKLSDFKPGDYISLRTSENIAGKTEFDKVIRIFLYRQ
jgi:nitrogen fixation protein